MNANTQHPPADPAFTPAMFAPLACWAAGFEYAFGYQMQLLWDFWGFTHDGH